MGLLDAFDKLAEYEDEQTVNYLYSHYGPLVQMSCVYPSYKRSMLPITLTTFAWHTLAFVTYIVLLLITVQRTMVYWDLEIASLALHITLLALIALISIYYVQFQRGIYFRQSKMSAKDIGSYRSGRIYDEDWCVEELKKIEKEKMYFLALPALILIGSGIVLILPYTFKLISGMENPYSPGMVNVYLPCPCWYPFPTHEGALHWTAVTSQFLTAGSMATVIATLLLFFLNNSQNIKYELRVVGYSMRTLFPRSMKLYLQMNPKKNRGDVQVLDTAYQKVVGMCIIDSVIHHHTTAELVSFYAQQNDVPAFLALAIGTAVIGMSLYNILEALKANNFASIILFTVLLMCETLTMLILSALGEQIAQQSIALRDELYCSEWHNLDNRNRKLLLIFHTALTEPIVISSMGMVSLRLETFSSIMNTAYSFFNLMNTRPGE